MKRICYLYFLIMLQSLFAQSTLEFKNVGFAMHQPERWIMVLNEDIIPNLNKFDFSEKQLQELLSSSSSGTALASLSKYDQKKVAGIIPTINIKSYPNPTKNDAQFLQFVQQSLASYKRILDNLVQTQAPNIIKLSSKSGVVFGLQFTLKVGAENVKISSKSYYIPKNGYFISVNFVEQLGKEDNSALFAELANSIVLTP